MLDKMPKWALICIVIVLLKAADLFIPMVSNNFEKKSDAATAELGELRGLAYQARNKAEKAFEASEELKAQVADVRGAIEVNRKEYREDRIRDGEALRSMEDRIIRAVKS